MPLFAKSRRVATALIEALTISIHRILAGLSNIKIIVPKNGTCAEVSLRLESHLNLSEITRSLLHTLCRRCQCESSAKSKPSYIDRVGSTRSDPKSNMAMRRYTTG